jgi:hypothetical protein
MRVFQGAGIRARSAVVRARCGRLLVGSVGQVRLLFRWRTKGTARASRLRIAARYRWAHQLECRRHTRARSEVIEELKAGARIWSCLSQAATRPGAVNRHRRDFATPITAHSKRGRVVWPCVNPSHSKAESAGFVNRLMHICGFHPVSTFNSSPKEAGVGPDDKGSGRCMRGGLPG